VDLLEAPVQARSQGFPTYRAGGLGRHPDPSAVVGLARHPPCELLRPITGEHQMGVRVDEPGHHAPASGVHALVRRRAGPTYRDHGVPLDHHRSVLYDPERSRPEPGDVGDQFADVVDHQRHAATTLAMAESSSPTTSTDTWAPPTTTGRPPTTRL